MIYSTGRQTEYINAFGFLFSFLIIDDLGVERNSEYALGIIFSVIDRRIRSGRPLIITTNLPLNEIKSETMLDKKRIYDRIFRNVYANVCWRHKQTRSDCKYENGESKNVVEYKE